MKFLSLLTSALLFSTGVFADNAPQWMRYPQISPDGETIVFTYKGDIYSVPTAGGRATQLTTHPAHDTQPIWSPDGKKIAFASNRNGSFDIFVMEREGGVPTRLTTHSTKEMPETFLDNEHVLYTANMMQDVNDSQFPSSMFPQIYKVSLKGERPELFSSLAMENVALNKKGDKMLYHDKKGYEDPMRKHHQSSITRDVWMASLDGERTYKKITTFRGEDRNPVWAPDEQGFYYLSEENGSFNIYKSDLEGKHKTQITRHKTHPVRFLSSDEKGTLCYGFDGEIYTVKEGEQPRKVSVKIVADNLENQVEHHTLRRGAYDLAVSPDGKEVAFIVHGDVFVTSTEYETTRQITNTPQQERDLSFSPDGRSLVYSAERGKTWGIYKTDLVRKEDKLFTYAHELKEEALVETDKASFQPSFSPDGKEVAFLEERTTLRVINLKSKKVRTVLEGKYNYSYADGDQEYEWAPDSKWFLARYISVGGWQNPDIVLVKADGSGEMTNLTESGYSDSGMKWAMDGKAMIWKSDRQGYRSHGSWGSHYDAYIMFFDGEAYDKFLLSKEEVALLEEQEKAAEKEKAEAEKKDDKKDVKKDGKKSKKDDKSADKKDAKKDDKKKDEVKPLKFDLENNKYRVLRLTVNSSNLRDGILNKKGDKFYYLTSFEGGSDLWVHDLKDHSSKIVLKGVGGNAMRTDKKHENIYLLTGGGIKKVSMNDNSQKPISFRAEFTYRPAEEREYIFNHTWRQVLDKFYDPEIHGIDWVGYQKEYSKYLSHINNNFDFTEMLSEMLGELNGSHTGARYFATTTCPETAYLGAFYDNNYKGDGLKIAEILKRGPLDKANSKIKEGCVIEKINGQLIKEGEDYYPLLSGKVQKRVLLTVFDPQTKKRFEEEVKPFSASAQNRLLYRRWVESKREMVEKLSGGKVGYVHIKGMDSESFREVYSHLLGHCRNMEAVVVDTRHNGGGWLHEDLAILLSGEVFAKFMPRGQFVGNDPFNRWTKPSCVLMCEDNYSNAHGFPWTYQTLKLGKLIGAPVPGTMTAVWWETQIDPTIVFGIPEVGMKDMQGRYLENLELQPDIEIYNTPESQLRGEDQQLVRAVEEMMKTIKK